MNRHVKKVHEGIKPIKDRKCDQCGEMFENQDGLRKHLKHSHDKSRPLECSKCRKNFYTKERLNHHIVRYHQMRNVEMCPYCDKQYSQLQKHIPTCNSNAERIARERRRQKCMYCDSVFLRKESLNRHVKQFHMFAR